jgi:hypothetical protein
MKKLFSLALVGLLAGAMFAPAGAAKIKKPLVVGTDVAGDFNVQDDPTFAPAGDQVGADLVKASIGMADAETINFIIGLNKLQTVPEVMRYTWGLTVDGEYAELDGKFTNYSRGACDPTSGQCPPPRDPGQQPFIVRGNCTTLDNPASPTTTCQELGIVKAVFDAEANTITIPVPAALINAKPGTKIAAGTSDFSSQAGGNVMAIAAAFLSRSDFPRDTMFTTKTFTVPR